MIVNYYYLYCQLLVITIIIIISSSDNIMSVTINIVIDAIINVSYY